ncbi:hypothetical protein ACMD2_26774 [Ananas comosus]
MFTPA